MNQSQRLRTNEQIAREFEVLKEIEAEKAKSRQVEAAVKNNETFNHGTPPVVENSPPQVSEENDKARDLAAEKTNTGKSGRTLDESLKVVKYAKEIKADHPEKSEYLLEKLNTGSINKKDV